jgi:predicted pyridoxine 5'-phosphate oxidase superfamily flavin-nucleotide-binding protein
MVLPEEVRSAWDDRVAPSALATVDADGTPNVIWVTCLTLLDDGSVSGDAQVGIADNYFNKTLANVLRGSRGALVIRTNDNSKPYQLKGRFEYLTEGRVFEGMKVWNLPGKPGKGTAVFHVEEVHTGAKKLC